MKEKNVIVKPKRNIKVLKNKAYLLVVIHGESQKEVAKKLNLSETTLSKWSKDGNWRELRDSNIDEALRLEQLTMLMTEINKIENKSLKNKLIKKLIGEGV